ncbi:hypothetical protein BV20DRAFT_962643 [Pilatotrama ljubarskyi]|nr:hypothetical protein BV20DRAFT_962643 [Pilatotrama ljubarskyi]
MADSLIVQLPEELQTRIIGELDEQSILSCRKAGSDLPRLIDETVELQYSPSLGWLIVPLVGHVLASTLTDYARIARLGPLANFRCNCLSVIGINTVMSRFRTRLVNVRPDAGLGSLRLYQPAAPFTARIDVRVVDYKGSEDWFASQPDLWSVMGLHRISLCMRVLLQVQEPVYPERHTPAL